jgi:hypothetical protein
MDSLLCVLGGATFPAELRAIRHSGERRNPEAACTAFVSLDTGFRRYDA